MTRQVNFGQLGLISDTHINFQMSLNGPIIPKLLENINYAILKYGETFYGLYTALPIVIKGMTLGGSEHTRKTEIGLCSVFLSSFGDIVLISHPHISFKKIQELAQ